MVPIVSVDLVVKLNGGILLGKRRNAPTKGEWFVPGGTVFKNERLEGAVRRVARDELGCDVDIVKSPGAYEHFYDTSEVDGIDSKHYLANAFLVEPRSPVEAADGQHERLRVFHPPYEDLRPYVKRDTDALQSGVEPPDGS